MRKYIMLLLSGSFSFFLYGQTYTLNVSTQPYQELTTATDITGGNLWDDDSWQLPFGFNMPIFSISQINVPIPGKFSWTIQF